MHRARKKDGSSPQSVSKQECFSQEKGAQPIANAKFKAVLQLRSGILRQVNKQGVIEYAIKRIYIHK